MSKGSVTKRGRIIISDKSVHHRVRYARYKKRQKERERKLVTK